MKYLLVICCLVMFISCGDDDSPSPAEVICTTEVVPSFRITVRNTEDNSLLEGVSIVAKDQQFEAALTEESSGVYVGPDERAGSYFLIIQKENFQTIITETFNVEEDECHVITVSRLYTLQSL
ncbi:hypothetical protein [Dokdonia sp. 4H-3-7-5]|jgi:hypothetical protein|uniref:hypothetical protein n=1 Tax=Dokdonia sp. (strain 4H-3-7-5) TaxID=983548 RepID=UPI00020A6FA6|nr:hypothetical protein [Dokdonia sp. 4H-3-7-5]AEE20264.1 hypothetical protein Krodi_2286 [Dokdonia sp. 4H-3-7-5]